MKEAIAYYRVSTDRQGNSGLGLDAQRQAVQAFTSLNGYHLIAEFIEVETTRRNNRPVLKEALDNCSQAHATLLIAKLDRLARNVAFVSKLMEASVDFKAVDNPHASKFIVHIMAAFAEHERDMISERTTAALQQAKARGVELGKYGKYVLSVQNRQNADRFAQMMMPVFFELKQSGITTVRAIADELNRRKIPTFRQRESWYATTVHNVIRRLGAMGIVLQ